MKKQTRFAIYARISSEMQNELSIHSQIEQCKAEVLQLGGDVVDIFVDEAVSGWSLDRPGFIALRQAAEKKRFDAVMFWKFDRLARDPQNVMLIKLLLRKDFDLSLHCVEGYSEDDDDSDYSTMMEQVLAVFSAYYSKNLSNETKRGKKHRAMNGYYNGSNAPFGYELVMKKYPDSLGRDPGLYIVPREAAIVRRAFKLYATGQYSDRQIADWMNQRPYVIKLREGQKPVNKGMVRDMLQNRTYTGRVPYAETFYSKTLGQGKKSPRRRKQWFEGKHQGFISDELFDKAQQARQANTKFARTQSTMKTYLLHDRVLCVKCLMIKPDNLDDSRYARMRPTWIKRDNYGYYRCLRKERSYKNNCGQPTISVSSIDYQVVEYLRNLQFTPDIERQIEKAVDQNLNNARNAQRIQQLEDIMNNMDLRFDQGLITDIETYVKQRIELKREYEALDPVPTEQYFVAKDLLKNFNYYWEDCETSDDPDKARQNLIKQIVDRVFVDGLRVVAISLYGNHVTILPKKGLDLGRLIGVLRRESKTGNITFNVSSWNGSDEI